MSRDTRALAVRAIAQTMVFANDLVALNRTHAQRHTAMKADVARRRHRSIGKAIHHHSLVQQASCVGLVCYFMGEGNWIPEGCERMPVCGCEGTSARKTSVGHQLRSWHKRLRGRHGPL